MTLIPLTRLLVEGRSEKHPVSVRDGKIVNFGQFRSDGAAAAGRFKGLSRASLLCKNSYNFAVGFFGLLHAGVEILLPSNDQQELLEKSDLTVDDATIENSGNDAGDLRLIDPAWLSLIFFTSGSTGTPKKVSKNLAMLEGEIAVLDAMWGKDLGPGPVFATVPHHHLYGLTFKLLWPLMAGRPFVAEIHEMPENLVHDMRKGAVIVSSPAHLSRLEGMEPLANDKRPSGIFSAGSPLSFAGSQQTETIFGWQPNEIFGSTETGAFATRCQTNGDEPWQLLPGIDMHCTDDCHLVLRSAFMGPDWVTTADLVEPVPGGFRSLGRADRIVKIEGKRVSLASVEDALLRLPFIRVAAVTVVKGKSDRLAAVLVLTDEGRVTLNEKGNFRFGRLIRNQLAANMEAAAVPHVWRFVDELPAQILGKRRDADIRALFEDDT